VHPKNKIRALIFGLVLPYFILVMYFVLRIRDHPLPTWFPYFGLTYLLGSIILVTLVSRKIAGAVQPKAAQSRPALRVVMRAWAGYLIAVWCGLFLWGAVEMARGKLEWQRALPAGAFLLAFILIFARLLYTDIKPPNAAR
jgi:hypothetical protein